MKNRIEKLLQDPEVRKNISFETKPEKIRSIAGYILSDGSYFYMFEHMKYDEYFKDICERNSYPLVDHGNWCRFRQHISPAYMGFPFCYLELPPKRISDEQIKAIYKWLNNCIEIKDKIITLTAFESKESITIQLKNAEEIIDLIEQYYRIKHFI